MGWRNDVDFMEDVQRLQPGRESLAVRYRYFDFTRHGRRKSRQFEFWYPANWDEYDTQRDRGEYWQCRAKTISQVGVSGTGFSANGINPPVTLSVGQSATFNVVFAPTTGTSVTGSVSIASNASNPSLTIPLTGTGISPGQVTVTPTSASFGNVVVGTQQSQTGTPSAVGGPVTISSIGINGTQFSVSGISLPLGLAAGQNAPFTLTFAPQATGTASGAIGFISASGSATQSVSGTGIAAPQHS